MTEKFLNRYQEFVDTLTSQESKELDSFIARIKEIHASGINVPRLLTGSIGLAAEGGEFSEIVKKMIFQGKPVTDENKQHMIRELGDVCWYLIQSFMALGVDPYTVFETNIEKLKARYPGGEFDPWFSENRKQGDL